MEQNGIYKVYIEDVSTFRMIMWRCRQSGCDEILSPIVARDPTGSSGSSKDDPRYCRKCQQTVTNPVASYYVTMLVCDMAKDKLTEYKLYSGAVETLIGCEVDELLEMIDDVPDLLELLRIALRGSLCDIFLRSEKKDEDVVSSIYLHGRNGLQMLFLKN
ncbi:hypothetical protein J3Q64DRAFT_1771215 [Phycomyces blakesleeanus]|uniref:Replication factor A C-terminal domain-containing protein n=1 Tax=Phycomyces blakesleeanus TaxID=4837 RepID=A0ABR3ALN1_PHYBL